MTKRSCRSCGLRPAAITGTRYCFACWPGGPVTPPACLRCGSRDRYWSAGLCEACHPRHQRRATSCRYCLAWGLHRGRVCQACESWAAKYPRGGCDICAQLAPVGPQGACRLCYRQRALVLRHATRSSQISLADANRHGRQLFFADMVKAARNLTSDGARSTARAPIAIRPVDHRQLVLLEVPADMRAGLRHGFPAPKDPALAAALWAHVRDHAAAHGWSRSVTERAQRGVRILLGQQHTAGAPIRASDVALLSEIGISVRGITEVLAAAGMLEDDRVPAIERWFPAFVAELPEQMRAELAVWFDIGRNGSTTAPRLRARSDATVSSQLHFAMPALRAWATTHASLREISREDVHRVLPASGWPRSTMLQGLRSIFRVLKARQLVFVNPTARIAAPTPDRPAPRSVDLAAVRAALDSDDVVRAALAGLLAFHAVRVRQLCGARLTDVRDGRLHVGDQVILLAAPVRDRLAAWLDERAARWPGTANPHLFIHYRNANTTTAVTPWWIRKRLGMSGQALRQDRILDEAHASAGDIRLICDLFGLSPAGAYRYTSAVGQLDVNSTSTS